jgi:hypothetical protein
MRAALQMGLAGIQEASIDKSDFDWILKLAEEIGPKVYTQAAESVAKKCTNTSLLWEYTKKELDSGRFKTAIAFFASIHKYFCKKSAYV